MAQEVREEWNAQVLETLGVAPSEAPELLLDVPPKVGDRVRVADVPTAGRILEKRDEDDFEVEVGRLKMRVRREQIKVLADSGTAGEGPGKGISPTVRVAGGRFASAPDASAASAIEINVIGTTAEEACEQVDKFLDRAFLNGRFRVRVIHGFGKGILRKALHDLFAAHLHVEKYYAAPQHEGAGGATIVELKL
jgi:DNA mismatch repair protein MutS2